MRTWALGVTTLLVLASSQASAGERPFLWAYDTTIVPNGNVELEQWLWVRGAIPPTAGNPEQPAGYWLWWSPVVGVTRHIEVAVPFQVLASKGGTFLNSFDADVRWRLFPQDDLSGFQGLVRTAYHQETSGASRFDFNVSASHGGPTDPRMLVEIGGQVPLVLDPVKPETAKGTVDLGFAYPFMDGRLALSAEAFGFLSFEDHPTPSVSLRGGLAWISGRFWVTLGLLVSLTAPTEYIPRFMPRLIWAVAL
jgi:hypothetical protein